MAAKSKVNAIREQKERRQKIILAVGGVIFLVLAVIQGPKLWKQLNPESKPATPTAAVEAQPTDPTTTATPSSGTSTAPQVTSSATSRGGSALLAGVPVAPSPSPEPDSGQLASFSRFKAKDPFVPQVAEPEPGPSADGSPRLGDTQPNDAGPKPAKQKASGATTTDATPAPAGSVAPVETTNVAPAEPAPENATISVNGSVEPVELKGLFPKRDKLFVLAGLTDTAAKIGVAGGSLTSGKTVKLGLGRQITLVDTATGARYVLKLLYSGSEPEQIQKFTTKAK
jgi:hypothetical protein